MISPSLTNGSVNSPAPDLMLASSAPADGSPAVQPSLLALIDDRLRGRWRLAVSVGILLGLASATIGFATAPVRYWSTGTVHVAPRGLMILRDTADTRLLPKSQYESFLATQALLIRSSRVLSLALDKPEVAALPPTERPASVRSVGSSLTTSAERGTELIMVRYESEHPGAAAIILNAVLASYEELYGNNPQLRREKRLVVLRRTLEELRGQMNATDESIRLLRDRSKYGPSALEQLRELKLRRNEELQQELDRFRLDNGQAAASPGQEGPTMRGLVAFDPALPNIRLQYETQRIRVIDLEQHFHPSHLICERARRELQVYEELLHDREEAALAAWQAAAPSQSANQGSASLYQQRIAALLADNDEALLTLTQDLRELNELKVQRADTETKLAEVEETIRIHKLEGGDEELFSGRITVIATGVPPTTPSKDRRRAFAGLGFFGGLCGSLAFFFVIGTIDRRAYSARQLRGRDTSCRCLGVIPKLATDHPAEEAADRAAQCVHQIRNRLETLRDIDDGLVLAVTSPSQGDGKTTVAMALASSYAAAQHRTVIIDCDLVGQNASRRAGHRDATGLREALRQRHFDPSMSKPLTPNLSFLACGLDPTIGPESIRSDDFRSLCLELRSEYDVVIIDTGPLTGSIELLPMVSCVTGVVLVIERGRSRGGVEEAVQGLNDVGVPVLGVVLNRADESDCNRYVSESARSRRTESTSPMGKAVDADNSGERLLFRAMTQGCDPNGDDVSREGEQ